MIDSYHAVLLHPLALVRLPLHVRLVVAEIVRASLGHDLKNRKILTETSPKHQRNERIKVQNTVHERITNSRINYSLSGQMTWMGNE